MPSWFKYCLLPAIAILVLSVRTVTAGDCVDPRLVSCPFTINVDACQDGSQVGAIVTYDMPVAEDDCGPLEMFLIQGLPSGSFFPVGRTTVVWRTGLDDVGDYVECQFEVRVAWPRRFLGCVDVFATACDPRGAYVTYDPPVAVDNCGPVPVHPLLGQGPGTFFPVGPTGVRWRTDVDANGEFQECMFFVTVTYPLTPGSAPNDTTLYSCDSQAVPLDYTPPTFLDTCGNEARVHLAQGFPPGSPFPPGQTTVVWETEIDGLGNQERDVFFVRVLEEDLVPPTITCPRDTFVVVPTGQSSAVVNYQVSAHDNCQIASLTCVPTTGSTFPCGTTTVSCIARDAAGGTATCSFTVTVAQPVPLDIQPGTCPNPFNVRSLGTTPVAIMGTPQFDVTQIDPASILLAGVAPTGLARQDVGAPFAPYLGRTGCLQCGKAKKDGRTDLTLKFDTQALVAAMGTSTDGQCRVLRLTARLRSGCPVVGEDVVRIQSSMSTTDEFVDVEAAPPPPSYVLHANTPNPFSPSTRIQYDLRHPARVRLTVYDLVGREVQMLVDESRPAGAWDATWDGRTESGTPAASGVYFYRLTIAPTDGDGTPVTLTRKMILGR